MNGISSEQIIGDAVYERGTAYHTSRKFVFLYRSNESFGIRSC